MWRKGWFGFRARHHYKFCLLLGVEPRAFVILRRSLLCQISNSVLKIVITSTSFYFHISSDCYVFYCFPLQNLHIENESLKKTLDKVQSQLDTSLDAQDQQRKVLEAINRQFGDHLSALGQLQVISAALFHYIWKKVTDVVKRHRLFYHWFT